MASRLTTKRSSEYLISDDENDLNFLNGSQQSNGSEDQDFELVLAKHYAALREKKKKENEHKLLKAAYKQLSKEVAIPAEDVKNCAKALEAIYEDFLQQYAASEDTIHKLWTQVHKEQQKFLTFTQNKLAINIETAKKIESGQISGLSRTQAACRGLQKIINQIVPDD